MGQAWKKRFYGKIVRTLNISPESDLRSRNTLSELLRNSGNTDFHFRFWSKFENVVGKEKIVFAFGRGSSLLECIETLPESFKRRPRFVIAADGAGDLLIEQGIMPSIIVSDLDSCSPSLLLEQSEKRSLFVHAHGDNIPKIQSIVPKLGPNVLGTTQVDDLENVKNLGGFTDGDRACYLAHYLRPKIVILCGIDLGVDNRRISQRANQSFANKDRAFKKEKLLIGRECLRFLIKESKVNFVSFGISSGMRWLKVLNQGQLNEFLS